RPPHREWPYDEGGMWMKLLAAACLPLMLLGAGDAALDRATLKGLTALNVVIDHIDPELEKEGLTRSILMERLEGKLQSVGVDLDRNATAFLALRVLQVRDRKGPYAVCMVIAVYQPVTLTRDRNMKTATATWEVETILMADPKLLYKAAISSVDEL